jgi:signal transduction histidine kinase
MKIFKLLFVLFVYSISTLLNAQNATTDSLEKLLQKRSLNDTTKLRLLADLSLNFSKIGSPKTLFYSNQLILKVKKQNNNLLHGNALYNIAIYYEKNNLFDSSLYMLKEARRIAKGEDKKLDANIEETMGANYFKKSQIDTSLICFEKALKMQYAVNDSNHILSVLNNLGILYSIKGNVNKGQDYFIKCLKIHEAKGDSIAITRSYINLGLVMLKAKLLNKAHFYLQRAISIALTTKDTINLINGYRNIGVTYEKEKKYDLAINENLKALKYINDKNISQRASVEQALSSCYLLKNDYLKALEYLLPALKVKEMLGQQEAVSGLLINLASIKLNMGQFEEAIVAATKASNLADETESTETKMNAAEILLGCYIKTGNTKKAFDMYNEVFVLNDSVYNMNLSNSIADIQVKYETEKKEQENELLQKENNLNQSKLETRNRTIIILVFAIVLIGVVIVWRINTSKLKKKELELEASQKIQKEKERISRDLHDNVGGQLSYVLYSLDDLDHTDTSKRNEIKTNINESVRSVIQNLRETIWAINDESLTINDLSDKLKVYSRSMFKNSNTKIVFSENIESDIILNSLVGLNLYRICQEIINNAFKYSNATQLKFTINSNEKATIVIEDDGNGFDLNEQSEGFGLKNIHDRAQEIGASVTISAIKNQGVTFTIVV